MVSRNKLIALWLSVALSGCSGSPWYQRSPSVPGVSISYNEDIFRDLERIIEACANPMKIVPGMSAFVGAQTVLGGLGGCDSLDGIRYERFTDGVAPQRQDRLRNAANSIALISQPFEPPVPSRLTTIDFDRSNAAELIPILGDEIRKLDGDTRASLSTLFGAAQSIVRMPGALCQFRGRAAVELNTLKLRNVRFSWRRTGLSMKADIDDSTPQAVAAITTSIPCRGSTNNPANSLLKAIVPDGSRSVRLRNATIEMTFDFSVRLPEKSGEAPRLSVRRDRVVLTVARMALGPSGSANLDAASDDALRKIGFTASDVAKAGSEALRPAAEGIAPALESLIFESLDLELEADLMLKLVGVEFEETRPGVNRRMRFETMRSDKVCFFKPGGRIVNGQWVSGTGEWVCTDPFGTKPEECRNANGLDVCWEPPVGPRF